MSSRRNAFRLADELKTTILAAPTRQIGSAPRPTEKEEAPRAELTDAGQSSRARAGGQEKGRVRILHGARRLRCFDGGNAAMSRSLWARFGKSSGSHYLAAVASVQLSRSRDVALEGAGKGRWKSCSGLIRSAANGRNWSSSLIPAPRPPTLVPWLDCGVLGA